MFNDNMVISLTNLAFVVKEDGATLASGKMSSEIVLWTQSPQRRYSNWSSVDLKQMWNYV